MNRPAPTAADEYAAIAHRLCRDGDVDEGRGLQSPTLRSNGKIFAMLASGRLVVKLPEPRCRGLAREPGCAPFESGGRKMREWISIDHDGHDWQALAREALAAARDNEPRKQLNISPKGTP